MQIQLLKSKVHRAEVTGGSLDYEGSLTMAEDLMDRAGFMPNEKILCSNLANGNRFETYLIPGPRESGAIILNGATAHLGKPGDLLTIMSFVTLDANEAKKWRPKVLVLGKKNQIVSERGI